MLAEANVSDQELTDYFGQSDGIATRVLMVFAFRPNQALVLALARRGEVYLLDLKKLVEYINTGDELHLAHNFVFFHLPWQAAAFRASVQEFTELAEVSAWPAWFLENHDHSRIATRYAAEPGIGQRRARLAAMLICSLRGTPFLYYGQELGLPDAELPADRAVDVDGRDPERAPMPWLPPTQAGPGAGFTSAEPWLPVVADAGCLCVESQHGDPGSTLAFVRRLIHLRSREPTRACTAGRAVLHPGVPLSLPDLHVPVEDAGDGPWRYRRHPAHPGQLLRVGGEVTGHGHRPRRWRPRRQRRVRVSAGPIAARR